jgi:DNA-binding NarL/FixJ family response regulator
VPGVSARLRIVLAEDAALLREGLVGILERAGHEVVAAVEDADALLAFTARLRPDLVVTDIRMPPTHTDEGLRAAARIRAEHPGIAILVLSAYVAEAYVSELLDATSGGGIGYLLKDRVAAIDEFLDALARVAAGGTVLDPEVISQLLVRRRRNDPLAELTPREREVLALMAEGRSNTAIARALVVSDGAVEKHVRNIFTKLDLPPDATNHHRRVLAVLTHLRA